MKTNMFICLGVSETMVSPNGIIRLRMERGGLVEGWEESDYTDLVNKHGISQFSVKQNYGQTLLQV